MSEREPLAVRRAELIALCAVQRGDLAFAAADAGRSLWIVDATVAASRRVAAHPALLAGVVVLAVVVLRPARLIRLLTWGLPAVLSARRAATLWLRHQRGTVHAP
jgi:hypothetical protein